MNLFVLNRLYSWLVVDIVISRVDLESIAYTHIAVYTVVVHLYILSLVVDQAEQTLASQSPTGSSIHRYLGRP